MKSYENSDFQPQGGEGLWKGMRNYAVRQH